MRPTVSLIYYFVLMIVLCCPAGVAKAQQVKTATINGVKYIAQLKNNSFSIFRPAKRRVLKVDRDYYIDFKWEDFDKDGYKDILLEWGSNSPEVYSLYLFVPSSETFREVQDFPDFAAPMPVKGTHYFYSYNKAGCADLAWRSYLFYIKDYKAVKTGIIRGDGCGINDGITIFTCRNKKERLVQSLPLDIIEKYKDHKWGFIKQYWAAHYRRFVFSQQAAINTIDIDLTNIYKNLSAADYPIRNDSLAPLFKRKLLKALANPMTFKHPFDSLSKYISIRRSKNGKTRFFGWDDLDGGSWHSINSIAQYAAENGQIMTRQISADEMKEGGYSDCSIYKVEEIIINKTIYYLTLGWGTHGSGMQFDIVQIFTITGNSLVRCNYFFKNNNALVVEYPRSETLNLAYNAISNEITYNEFSPAGETGRPERTGKTIVLKLYKSKFVSSSGR